MYCDVGGALSQLFPVVVGVPQGTVLGPVLFLVFSFDLKLITSNYLCFADDTTLYEIGKNEKIASENLIKSLNIFNNWVSNNKLSLNWDKSKILTLGEKENLTAISIDNIQLDNVSSFKLVGLNIDHDLSWKPHIQSLIPKLKLALYSLNQIKYSAPLKTKLLLYNSIFLSHVTFGLPIWGNTFQSCTKQIKILMKKAIRSIFCAEYNASTSPLYEESGLFNYNSLLDYHSILLARSIRINNPDNLSPLLTTKEINTNMNIRSNAKFDQVGIPSWNCKNSDQNCYKVVPRLWNNLPCDIKQLPNTTFKKYLKKHLLEIQKTKTN